MALINCPECSKEISDKVKACPHCGFPMSEESEKPQEVEISSVNIKKFSFKQLRYVLVSMLSVAVIACGIFFVNGNLKNSSAYNSALDLMEKGQYGEAETAFLSLENYKDSSDKVLECRQLYGEKFDEAATFIYIDNLLSQFKCALISDTWSKAIKDSKKKDFNVEIQNLLSRWKELKENDTTEFSDLKTKVDGLMKNIKSPTSNYKEAYPILLEMYGTYIQIYDQSVSPSGSLLTYNQSVNGLSSQFEKSYNQLSVIKPEVAKEIENKKDNLDIVQLL